MSYELSLVIYVVVVCLIAFFAEAEFKLISKDTESPELILMGIILWPITIITFCFLGVCVGTGYVIIYMIQFYRKMRGIE